MIYLPDTLAHNFWRISVLAPSQFPDDEDTDGSRSVGLLALRTPDAAASPRTFTEFSRQEIFTLCNKARTWP